MSMSGPDFAELTAARRSLRAFKSEAVSQSLLDEVFAGLTSSEIEQVSGLLAEKRQEGLTFVIVSHDLRSLEPLIDRAIAMNQGTFVCQGTYHEVMNNEAVRMAYLGH